jgi:hypothetical protein
MGLRRARLLIPLLLVGVAIGCSDESAPSPSENLVYKVSVVSLDGQAVEGRIEWVAPATGQWRIEQEGTTGEKSVLIYSKPRWANVGHYVAVGSPRFIAGYADESLTLEPLRRHLASGGKASGTVRTTFHGHELELVIEEHLTEREAERQGLFTISTASATTVVRELSVGARPSLPIKPYWFGPRIGEAQAVIATQTRSHGPSYRYDVYYELPSAGGKSGALPNEVPPPGEIQAISLPLRRGVPHQIVEQYKLSKYSPIVLADGERATFFPFPAAGSSEAGFAIATKTTLVQVLGPAVTLLVEEERADLAARLRPLWTRTVSLNPSDTMTLR